MKSIINRKASKKVTSYYRNNAQLNKRLKSEREVEQKKEKGDKLSC